MDLSLFCGYLHLFVVLVVFSVQQTNAFNCYSCSYTLTALPDYNYECVSAPWNFTVGQVTLPCDQHCITKTIYYKGFKGIQSLSRLCGTPEKYECGVNCCQSSFYNEGCQHACQGELCNNDTRVKKPITPGGTGSGPRTASILTMDKAILLCLFVLSLK